jgi:hypothetical protein
MCEELQKHRNLWWITDVTFVKNKMADKSMTVWEREDKRKGGHGYRSPKANKAATFHEHKKTLLNNNLFRNKSERRHEKTHLSCIQDATKQVTDVTAALLTSKCASVWSEKHRRSSMFRNKNQGHNPAFGSTEQRANTVQVSTLNVTLRKIVSVPANNVNLLVIQ